MNAGQSAPVAPPVFLLPRAIPKEQAAKLRMVSHAEAMVAAAIGNDEEQKWPPQIADALRVLTPKQRQYAIRVGAGQPQYSAYRASYDVDEGRADVEIYPDISHLNSHAKISQAVLILQTWLDRKWLLEAVEVKDYVASVLYEQTIAGDTSSARIKAAETLLRMHGLLIDKKEITHRDANEMDEQAQLFRSILADVNLAPVIEAEYTQLNQQLTGPSIGYVCPACNSRAKVHESFEAGDGI